MEDEEHKMLESDIEPASNDLPVEAIDRLKPMQIRFCNLAAVGSMDKSEIAKSLGVSSRKLTSWMKDENVQIYMSYLKRKNASSYVDTQAKMNRFVQDKLFAELEARFDEYDPDEVEGLPEWRQKAHHDRYVSNMPAKELMKLSIDFQKVAPLLDKGEGADEADQFISTIRAKYTRVTRRRRQRQQQMQDLGFNPEEMFVIDITQMNDDGTFKESAGEVVSEEVIEIQHVELDGWFDS
jgi:hypothetical protein